METDGRQYQVGCEDGEGLLHVHAEDETCGVCQAHGDALAALVDEIAPPIPPFNSEAEEEEYHCESAVRHYSERVRKRLRRHLTASGVPYLPEEVRRLPEKWRSYIGDPDGFSEAAATEINSLADELEAVIASAPADGYKLVPVEPTEKMLAAVDEAQMEHSANSLGADLPFEQAWAEALAAAPTDGRG